MKALFIFLIFGLVMSTANAQLLQDRNKLKTEKRQSRGFSGFKKQVRSASGRSKTISAGTPRYSKSIGGAGGYRVVSPRFSADPEKFGSYVARTPKTASDRSFVFEFPRVEHYVNRPKNHGEDAWNLPKSPGKAKKEGKDFHPSSNYMSAKYNSSKLIRDGLQKFNILWVRVNGNKTQPKGVYKKSKKLKFDKDETEIWNNKEREYSHN